MLIKILPGVYHPITTPFYTGHCQSMSSEANKAFPQRNITNTCIPIPIRTHKTARRSLQAYRLPTYTSNPLLVALKCDKEADIYPKF